MHQKLTSTLSQYDTIVLVGGGTGGHIQPIVSLSQYLQDKKLLWIGGDVSNEAKTAEENNIEFKSISTLKLATTKSWKILLYPMYLILGFLQARGILKSLIQGSRQGTQICLFSKGGPGSVAIGIAAWSLSIPLYIHESDTIPGRSNHILGKFATQIFLGFASAKKYFDSVRCEVIGQILNPVFEGKIQNKKQIVQWKTTKPHILVICGSQGSQAIFEAIIGQFGGDDAYEWIISLGKLNSGMQKDFENMKDTQALEWISQSDIANLIRDTDLAITRGSATTLAELTISGEKPKLIIIPLPYAADNHQYWNAKEYENMGHILLEQKNLTELKNTIITHLT